MITNHTLCFERITILNTTNANLHSHIRELEARNEVQRVHLEELLAELAALKGESERLKWMLNYVRTSAGGESIVATAESRWEARP